MAKLENLNITPQLFELWTDLINNMRFEFEYRRTMMAFTALLSLDYCNMNSVIRDNLLFLFEKTVDLSLKIFLLKEKKEEAADEVKFIFI
jgi:hypothetical protein